jgi:hypothetical protein
MIIDPEVEDAANACNSCNNCTPIGMRKKPYAITDGRFDTKKLCCETRRRETGCPVAVKIKQIREQCKTCIRNGVRDCMYHGYPASVIPKSCEYKIGIRAIDTVYDVPVLKCDGR